MKHNLPLAKTVTFLALLTGLTFCMGTCTTLPRQPALISQPELSRATTESPPPLNINAATSDELEKLPGVGKAIAERIVDYRATYGPFRRPEHLMMVRGISDSKFRKIRPLICVDEGNGPVD